MTISRPGSYHRSDELETSGLTFNQSSGALPSSLTVSNAVVQGPQNLVLQSGATIEHVTVRQTSVNGALFQTCTLVGDAVPAS